MLKLPYSQVNSSSQPYLQLTSPHLTSPHLITPLGTLAVSCFCSCFYPIPISARFSSFILFFLISSCSNQPGEIPSSILPASTSHSASELSSTDFPVTTSTFVQLIYFLAFTLGFTPCHVRHLGLASLVSSLRSGLRPKLKTNMNDSNAVRRMELREAIMPVALPTRLTLPRCQ